VTFITTLIIQEMASNEKSKSNNNSIEEADDHKLLNGARTGVVNHAPRRSKDLKIMTKELLTQSLLSNEDFDKFWNQLFSYGCHCFDHGTDRKDYLIS